MRTFFGFLATANGASTVVGSMWRTIMTTTWTSVTERDKIWFGTNPISKARAGKKNSEWNAETRIVIHKMTPIIWKNLRKVCIYVLRSPLGNKRVWAASSTYEIVAGKRAIPANRVVQAPPSTVLPIFDNCMRSIMIKTIICGDMYVWSHVLDLLSKCPNPTAPTHARRL